MDQRIQVHQLRQSLHTATLTSEEGLSTLLEHHLQEAQRSDSDRDKTDFLLVQFFSHCAPSRLEDADVDMEYVAQVLEPVSQVSHFTLPEWVQPLEEFIQAANGCRGLNELLSSGMLEKGRTLKDRKSTRLNSSHRCISYAVFCLKKKKQKKNES